MVYRYLDEIPHAYHVLALIEHSIIMVLTIRHQQVNNH